MIATTECIVNDKNIENEMRLFIKIEIFLELRKTTSEACYNKSDRINNKDDFVYNDRENYQKRKRLDGIC